MGQYFLRRLLLLPLTLFGITFLAFLITRFVPGGPLEQAQAEKMAAAGRGGIGADNSGTLSPEEELQLKRFYRMDQPVVLGYLQWLGLLPGPETTLVQLLTLPEGETVLQTEVKAVVGMVDDLPLLVSIPATITVEKIDGLARSAEIAVAVDRTALEKFLAEQNAVLEKTEKKERLPDAAALERQVAKSWKVKLLPPNTRPDALPPELQPVRVDVFQNKFDGILQGNLGRSFLRNKPVTEVILSKLPVSAWFGGWSLFLTYSVCIPLGVLKALRHKQVIDNVSSVLLFTGYALPGYVLAVVLQYFLAFQLHWFPHSGFIGAGLADAPFWIRAGNIFWHTVLPLACLTSGSFALMTMLMKNTLMDNLAMDYVRTAVAKGVGFRTAVLRHAFRNSLVPIATGLGNCLGALLTGSFLIEMIFDIDGIGLLGYTSLVGRDYPVFLGLLLFSSFLMLLGNILSDICVALVDPRIRFGK